MSKPINSTPNLSTQPTSSLLKRLTSRQFNPNIIIALTALFLVITANFGFFNTVLGIYPFADNIGFIVSMVSVLFAVMWLLFNLFTVLSYRFTVKPVLIIMLIIGAICGYFTDAYGTIFDTNMLVNGLETDHAEAMDLFAPSLILRMILLGVVPAVIIAKLRLMRLTWKQAIVQKVLSILACIALLAVCLVPFGDQYASFFRQHKQVRYYTNPITPVYSAIKLGQDKLAAMRRPDTLIPHATDAKKIMPNTAKPNPVMTGLNDNTKPKPKLMVFVVGETVRADHIGLNGYERNTTPRLSKQANVYSFTDATACGTSTAYSVPCMFSYMTQDNYDMDMAKYHENVLDTLKGQGVNVVWRDNNSSSKGVADRVTYEEFKTPEVNPVCDEECRDVGMLAGFDTLIKPNSDNLILLHQMGSHGPAYYKRYPKEFETYARVCQSSELSKCDQQSVMNGFDNTIVYTDYFLDQVINTLKPYEDKYDVVMVYMSDHGESLGENNIYLHGLPYKIAPKAQKHVPLIIWSPKGNGIDNAKLQSALNTPVSHDEITPTLLKFFNIKTAEVDGEATFF